MWLKIGANSSIQALWSSLGAGTANSGLSLSLDTSRKIAVLSDGGGTEDSYTVSTVLPGNTWVHFAFKVNSSGLYTYVNGTLVDSHTGLSGKGLFRIGATSYILGSNTNNILNITWDEAKIFNTEMSNAQIQDIYNTELSGLEAILNSPSNNQYVNSTFITFNTTVTSSLVATISNISLLTNETGTWAIRNVTTGLSDTLITQTWGRNVGTANSVFSWYVNACNSLGTCVNSTIRNLIVDVYFPTITLYYPSGTFTANKGQNVSLNFSVNDNNLDSCWYNYNNTNYTLNCNINSTIILGNYNQNNLTFYVNDSVGHLNSTFFNWSYSLFENSQSFNYTTYETAYETFSINMTGMTNAFLIYNGTSYSATISNGIATKSLDIETISADVNKTFYWRINNGLYNSSVQPQRIYTLNFTICNQTNNITYINYSFKDESTLLSLTATFQSTLKYWLGSGLINKTLSYTSSAENGSYSFCLNRPDRTLIVNPYIQYASSGYPQRIYNPTTTILTNSTTNKTLYLLSSADGLYVTFQVINSAEQPLENVNANATRLINGVSTIVGQGVTGADGGITFWVNPNQAHTFSFYLSPYPLYTTTITPTQSSYTITLGSIGTSNVSDYLRGISYSIKPSFNNYLLNGTTYAFNFTLSSTYWALDSYGFVITNRSGFILGSVSDTTSGGGIVNLNLNTGTNSTFIINYYYVINGTYLNNSASWLIIDTSGNIFSIARLVTDFRSYVALGFFGLTDFGVGIICFVIILTTVGTLKLKSGISDETTLLGVVFALVAFFDISLGLLPNPVGAVSNFPTILMGLIFCGFLFKEVFQ